MKGSPGHVVAGCFGLSAFAIAVVAGLASETPADSVLARSVFAMIICYPVGLVIGMICERAIQAHIDKEVEKGEVARAGGTIDDVPIEAGATTVAKADEISVM